MRKTWVTAGRLHVQLLEANISSSSYQSIYKSQDVVQVNLPTESGEMGVLANHVPTIEQLKPGLVEVIEESGGSKQYFRKWDVGDVNRGHRQSNH